MTVVFYSGESDNVELMRFDDNGDIFVRGEKVDSNQKVYETFQKWLGQRRATPTRCEANVEAAARNVFEERSDIDDLAHDDDYLDMYINLRELDLALIALDVERTK